MVASGGIIVPQLWHCISTRLWFPRPSRSISVTDSLSSLSLIDVQRMPTFVLSCGAISTHYERRRLSLGGHHHNHRSPRQLFRRFGGGIVSPYGVEGSSRDKTEILIQSTKSALKYTHTIIGQFVVVPSTRYIYILLYKIEQILCDS